MWERIERIPIVGVWLPFVLAAVFLWEAISSIRSGTVTGPYGGIVIADRRNDPVMFWIYVTGGLVFAFALVVIGIGGVSGHLPAQRS